ncbi:uncharacterized protein LOC132703028 [Cylas formicarius]|uniref:uncharacterized protein LOC132703028 n=1 Tax=Cylas formicarius TaxID=197179 RepID=UPI0029589583|nr:uncharacterized protein LOC132703028 [Cylas formicarius]
MSRSRKLCDISLKERYEKDERYITVYDTYTPNYAKNIITAKFYSKYEGHGVDEFDPETYKNLIRAKDLGPKSKLEWPETVNQTYGWYSEPLVEVDPKFYHPKIGTEITRHGFKKVTEGRSKK